MVDLRMSTLTVVKKADALGRDEPMLWTMFIELSLATLNSHQFVITTDPIASKLAKAGKGDTVNIPAGVGRFQRDGGGIFMAGVVVIAFDNDLRTNKQIRDGYAAGAAALNQAILEHFPQHGAGPITDAEREEIQGKVKQAVKDAFLADSVLLTVLGGKAIGGGTYIRNLDANSINEAISLTLHAKNDRAIYRADGRLTFTKN